MWNELPDNQKQLYKQYILAFSSLSELFAQKTSVGIITPIINSKFQESAFHKSFNAYVEDIGNTSYDASLKITSESGIQSKCLVGIKTFGFKSNKQKVAQFKAQSSLWTSLYHEIESSFQQGLASNKTTKEIVQENYHQYLSLVSDIARIRNDRIRSSIANLRGFDITDTDEVESVYHVLMPSVEDGKPEIYVGEISYDEIDILNIQIEVENIKDKYPCNVSFTDGSHRYHYTKADSQLLMDFDNKNIVKEKWDVHYIKDPFDALLALSNSTTTTTPQPAIESSVSWKLTIQPLSGFNGHYGLGYKKMSQVGRQKAIEKLLVLAREQSPSVRNLANKIVDLCNSDEVNYPLRDSLQTELSQLEVSEEFEHVALKLMYRPVDEIYIPLPNSFKFHEEHPDFFKQGLGNILFDKTTNKKTIVIPKQERCFELVFEPSGNKITSFITQDGGKGIQSVDRQSILGNWILREIFQLPPYRQLTQERLSEIGINGIKLYKEKDDDAVHLQFVWIDDERLPKDYWE